MNMKLPKTKNIRCLYIGMNDIKNGYQPKSKIVKHKKDDSFADCHCILAMCRKHFAQL